jgi:hypothetical protein
LCCNAGFDDKGCVMGVFVGVFSEVCVTLRLDADMKDLLNLVSAGTVGQ